jgi:CRP-like cAMP-binding protein
LAGLTLETTIRTLTLLKAEGIIDFEGKKICIHKKEDFLAKTTVV